MQTQKVLHNPVRRVLTWMRPFGRGIALSVVLGAVTIGSSIALMATSAWMISKAGLQPSIADLGVSVVGVRFFGIARGVFRYLERLVSHNITFRILSAIRVHLYRALEPLAPARLTAFRSGDLLGRVVGDVDVLQNIYLRAAAPPLVALLTAGLLTMLIAMFDGMVALVVLAWFIASAGALMALAWWLGQSPGRALVRERGALNAALVDTLQGLPDLIAYGAAQRQVALLAAQAERLANDERTFAKLDSLQLALMVIFPAVAALTVLALAIPRVEGIYLATLALATTAAYEAVVPLGQAASAWGGSLEAAARLSELVDTPPAVVEPAIPAAPPSAFDLTLENVSFRYAPDLPPVLRNFSLHIAQGERVAIIGESGAGKSTLVNILARFWDYEAGSIRVGGVELRNMAQEDVRQLFSIMSQHTYLFNTTIRENIRIARADADDRAVETAAKAAHIHDFIMSLEAGYETLVGENGAKLSGGQRQRIALARALLKDAPILILDEATAHIDAQTEREIMDTVWAACVGRTVIILTHNPHLLSGLNRVVVLQNI